jgi:signal transduction histidine kinase
MRPAPAAATVAPVHRPPTRDLAIAVALCAFGTAAQLGSESTLSPALTLALTAAYTLPLAYRRGAPLAIPVVVTAIVLTLGLIDPEGSQPTLPIAVGIVAYTLGHDVPLPHSAYAIVALLVAFWASMLTFDDVPPGDLIFAAFNYGAPWAFGRALRARTDQAIAARREAVEEERRRIARELHDVVAHALSVVAIQSQAIRRRLDPAQTREAEDLAAVESTVRSAMVEMRRLLGVLRADGRQPPLAPQPGLGDLAGLLEGARASGLDVHERVEVNGAPIAAGVELTAYRIVQEALTNVRRHAHAQQVRVAVHRAQDALTIEVTDDGRGGERDGPEGHGLAGMRERAAVFGGTLDAGPAEGGGYRVRAQLPLGARAPG